MRTAKTITVTANSYDTLERIKKVESKKRGYNVSYAILIAELLENTPSNKKM